MNRMIGFLLFWLAACSVAAQSLPMRLPGGVTPLSYHLVLTIDPDQPSHHGEISIALKLQAASRSIRLNATDIKVSSAVLEMAGQSYPASVKVADNNLLDLIFAKPVPAGQGELKMTFTGRLDDQGSQGLFRQKEGGDWYAFTQFEATSARRAFPVFDEPGWKVPWTLALIIPAKLIAVANTAVAREVPLANGMKRVEFLTTPPLPSYLVAFGVGPFDVFDAGKVGNTPLRFITPRGRASEASYAASMTPTIVAKLEAYFGMAYPYGKLDVMALPITLNFGAMENPGLVTFAARILLAKPSAETVSFKRRFVAVQAHELAHQWFGDYVTMAWWDDLWLNESFASWMGDKITAQVAPEWRFETGTQQARAWAMHTDRLLSARRIHQPVNDGESLESAFDGITYSKGQAVLAMFETWLGADKFQAGVRRYMASHAWGNATGDDFVAAIAGGDVRLASAFKSFTEQAGIPRLNITLVCQGKPLLKLSQSRFLPKGSVPMSASLWQIPVTLRSPAGQAQVLLKEESTTLALPDATCPAWVEANVNGAGYYRPVYAGGELIKLMAKADLSVSELLAHLDDAQALTESGDLPLADALALALHYAQHPRREVSDAALDILNRIEPLFGVDQGAAYADLWQRAFGAHARALGLLDQATDSEDDRLTRARWVERLLDVGRDSALRAQAKELAQAWLRQPKSLDAASRGLVLRSAAIDGDRAFFDALVQAVLISPDRAERADIYSALARFAEPELAQAALRLWLSPQHDIREIMQSGRDHYRNEAAREAQFRFVKDNFAAISKRLPKESMARFPQFFAGFCSAGKAAEVEQFFTPLLASYEGGASHLKQSLESIRLCAVYRAAQQASLADFLLAR